MNKTTVFIGLALFGQVIGAFAQPFGLGNQKFIPSNGKTLFFVGQDIDNIDQYIQATGRIPGGLMVYTSIQRLQGLTSPADDGGGIQHAQYLITKYPKTAIQIGLYMVGALDGILRGKYNTNIDKLGRWIKESHRPVFLRIGYEFDGPHNHYNPRKYKMAYRYIADRLRRAGVKNVAYIWHSYAAGGSRACVKWYPGDLYVDWVAISFFGAYSKSDREYLAKFAEQKGKPLMIAESTPSGLGVHQGKKTWDMWYQRYFDFIRSHNVKAICYINCDWDQLPQHKHMHWKDARIQLNPYIKEKWIEEINQQRYLHSSDNLFSQIHYVEE